jgi:hypothetical protein
MYILDTTTKTLVANLTAAVNSIQPEFTVTYADTTSNTVVEGTSIGQFSGTSDVTMVTAPASNQRRVIRYITVYNNDDRSIVFNLKYNNNGTHRQIARITLRPYETWYGQ